VFDFYAREGSTTSLETRFGGPPPTYHEDFFAASADARRIVFNANGRWTPDDTDDASDVYTASDGVVERISRGPGTGNHSDFQAYTAGMSQDGRRVLFETAENLTPDDTDYRRTDVFLRAGGTTAKLSAGNELFDATHVGHSVDAGVVVYETGERLTPDDTDDRGDLYLRSAGGTVKVTPGNGPHNARFHGISDDGAVVVFSTQEALTADDTDQRGDAYRWRGGAVRRISTGPRGGNANDAAVGEDDDGSILSGWVHLVADDGKRIVFWTSERLTRDDTDPWPDSYAWTAAGVERVSTGPSGGNGEGTAMVAGGSRDAARVVFGTSERITPDDRDDRYDLFERAGGVTRRVSTGPSGGNGPHDIACLVPRELCPRVTFVSADGSAIFFATYERLVREDRDDAIDVYRRAGGETILLSPARRGQPSEDVHFVDAAEDGSIAYVQTEERLTADDTNERADGYRVRLPVPLVAARPRALRLARGATRLTRRGPGVPIVLRRAGKLEVRIARLRFGRAVRVGRVRLRARAGRHVLRVGTRLPGDARLRPGRHRLTLASGDGPPARLAVRLRRLAG
jgi:hypothetical protein